LSGALGGAVGFPVGGIIGLKTGLPFTGLIGGMGLVSGGLGPLFTYLLSSGDYYSSQDLLNKMGWGALIGGGYGLLRGGMMDSKIVW